MTDPTPRRTHDWPQEPNGHYVEPAWCSAALFAAEDFGGVIHDPTMGLGHIVESARATGLRVTGADLIPRFPDQRPVDFLKTTKVHGSIVFNPPFRVGGKQTIDGFVSHAFARARFKLAFFVELQRLRAAHWLWGILPVRRVWMINPRPSVPSVDYILAGNKPCNGSKEYCWVVLEHGWGGYPEIWPLDCNP